MLMFHRLWMVTGSALLGCVTLGLMFDTERARIIGAVIGVLVQLMCLVIVD